MQPNTCPNCGAAIAADDPHGLCPACLLKEGLAETAVSSEAPAGGDPLRPALESKLQGQYRIVRLLGRGGMGAVYLARDLALDREVAVKVVHTSAGAREMYDRFRREARTAARLAHPNIVPLHAFGEVEGMPYFVMGYVRGESLADRLRREGKLSEEESRRVLAEIASALDHAHRQGVVHRDIKPDNVLIDDESGRAMLTDFGVAKGTGRGETMTMQGTVVGTPHYMSPEQASGRGDVDGRSDLYSLGVLAYVMLSGHLPFEGTSVADVLTKHLTQEPPPLRSLAPAVSDATAQIVQRCLAKDPNKRWPDARSLQIALGAPEEGALPDALQAVESQGITMIAIASVFLPIIRLLHAPWFALVLNAGVIAIAYVFVLARLRMDGFPLALAQQTMWREPAWWPFWYPRALRRRGNVWDRMPAAARRVRAWIPAFVVYTVVLFTAPFPNFARHPEAFVLKVVVGLALMLALLPILEFSARRELRRKGLTAADAHRVMLSVPPSRASFWARPHIAAVLAPAPPPTRAGSPHDYLQSILRTAESLSGPLRPLGADAAVAGRQLLASIDDADHEIRQLAQNIEPGEEARLTEKIAALNDDAAPLRSLLEKQLELVRALTSRIEEAKANRNRRIEMLKMLALHLASLGTQSNDAALTDRVQALCEEIRRQGATGS